MRWIAVLCRIVLSVAAALALAAPAQAEVFSNPASIPVPNSGTTGPAEPYPSMINVTGLNGAVTNVTATLSGVTHQYAADIDVLLVGPSGQSVVLMADAGGGVPATNVTLTFSDAAATNLGTPLASGTFRPTNAGAFNGTPPAPPPPYGAQLAVFNGTVANGQWRLFAFDDGSGDVGRIGGGWSLDITTNGPTITSFTPATGAPGTRVTLTGTNLTGTTRVAFGGVPADAFAVTSPTTIDATVPGNAVTGPISVTTPNGSGSSATPFTVAGQPVTPPPPTAPAQKPPPGPQPGTASATHARSISLSVSRRRGARGRVTVDDGFARCAANVPVKLQRRVGRRWVAAGSATTSSSGAYRLSSRRTGRYRAVAPPRQLASGDRCLRAVS